MSETSRLDEAQENDGEAEGQVQKRAAPRDSLFLHAVIRHLDSEEDHPLRVRNLSAGGVMAEGGSAFSVGDPVEIDLRGIGTQAARIAWVADGRIGVHFDRPVNPMLARRPVRGADKSAAPAPCIDAKRPGFRIR